MGICALIIMFANASSKCGDHPLGAMQFDDQIVAVIIVVARTMVAMTIMIAIIITVVMVMMAVVIMFTIKLDTP